jgi:hypothetical protein
MPLLIERLGVTRPEILVGTAKTAIGTETVPSPKAQIAVLFGERFTRVMA